MKEVLTEVKNTFYKDVEPSGCFRVNELYESEPTRSAALVFSVLLYV